MAKRNGTYALGTFCDLAHQYTPDMPTTKSGFMRDFFDAVLEEKDDDYGKIPDGSETAHPGKTSIRVGVWKGINTTDLVKFYGGSKKLPQWKAREFLQRLDIGQMEYLYEGLGIDALQGLFDELKQHGVNVADVNDSPSALGKWLQAILQANAQGRDLQADGPAFQPELDIMEGLPLSTGTIADNKLRLGHASVPWKPYPKPPKRPDAHLETTYLSQMEAAIADHLRCAEVSYGELPERYRKEYDRQREYFYDAEGMRRNLRDVVEEGEHEFEALKEDLYDGVCETCDADYEDGLTRMRKTLAQATLFPIAGSPLAQFPTMIRAAEKKGMCHMLVNDHKLEWVHDHE